MILLAEVGQLERCEEVGVRGGVGHGNVVVGVGGGELEEVRSLGGLRLDSAAQ